MPPQVKYYFDLLSEPSRALYIFLKKTKIQAEFHPVNSQRSEQKTENFCNNVNRLKEVPAIVDDGFQLSGSVAISRYSTNRYKIEDHWYPKNRHERARIDEYLEWQHLNTRLFCAQFFWTSFMKPSGVTDFPKPLHESYIHVDETLDDIEKLWLKPVCFISGTNQISFAEIEQLTISGFDPRRKRPNVSEWLKYIRHLTNPHYDEANVILNKLKEKTNISYNI